MFTYGTTMATTDLGYAKQMQYGGGSKSPRRHSVVKDDRGLWVTRCTAKPATREYKGWVESVNCQVCLAELEEKQCE